MRPALVTEISRISARTNTWHNLISRLIFSRSFFFEEFKGKCRYFVDILQLWMNRTSICWSWSTITYSNEKIHFAQKKKFKFSTEIWLKLIDRKNFLCNSKSKYLMNEISKQFAVEKNERGEEKKVRAQNCTSMFWFWDGT